VAVATGVVLLVVLGQALWRWNWADTDGDGLRDRIESAGWTTQDGVEHRTDPTSADTDGDGLTDLDEAGSFLTEGAAQAAYVGLSDPLKPDTDEDGLGDGEERNLGLDALDPDLDGDTLVDGVEVQEIGTAPDAADTDGDGFDDGYEVANRESQGLDPLWVDVQTDKWAYAADFAKGALAGDLLREESLAWLAGNLVAGGATSVPVVGQTVGALADLRDAIASAIQGDWVGSGYSAVGILPGGDALAVPWKAAEFIARNPRLAARAAAMVASSTVIPERIRLQAARMIWRDWDGLVRAGAGERALLQLQRGRFGLDDLARAIKRPAHIVGRSAGLLRTWSAGEQLLRDWYEAEATGVDVHVRASTAGCVPGCTSDIRMIDVLADGVAHESKVGRVALTAQVEGEIRKDAWLMKTGVIEEAHWHFFASDTSHTIGAIEPVYDLLEELGIRYTVHLPSDS
jgi:hypothetical protein